MTDINLLPQAAPIRSSVCQRTAFRKRTMLSGRRIFFLPLPLPPLLFLPSHLPSGLILLLSPIFLCHRIKDGGFIVAIRLTSFRSPKIRLHCRLRRFVEEFCQLCEEKMEKVERKRKTDRDLYEVEVVEAGYDAKKQLKIHFV